MHIPDPRLRSGSVLLKVPLRYRRKRAAGRYRRVFRRGRFARRLGVRAGVKRHRRMGRKRDTSLKLYIHARIDPVSPPTGGYDVVPNAIPTSAMPFNKVYEVVKNGDFAFYRMDFGHMLRMESSFAQSFEFCRILRAAMIIHRPDFGGVYLAALPSGSSEAVATHIPTVETQVLRVHYLYLPATDQVNTLDRDGFLAHPRRRSRLLRKGRRMRFRFQLRLHGHRSLSNVREQEATGISEARVQLPTRTFRAGWLPTRLFITGPPTDEDPGPGTGGISSAFFNWLSTNLILMFETPQMPAGFIAAPGAIEVGSAPVPAVPEVSSAILQRSQYVSVLYKRARIGVHREVDPLWPVSYALTTGQIRNYTVSRAFVTGYTTDGAASAFPSAGTVGRNMAVGHAPVRADVTAWDVPGPDP